MKVLICLSLPLIAAAIGWFANWLAIKMLFYPRKKIKFLFFEIQGVFPKRQALVAEKIGELVSQELLTVGDIKSSIANPQSIETIRKGVGDKVEDYIENTFPAKYPVLSLLMGKKNRDKFKNEFMLEVNDLAPAMIDKYMDSLGDQLDFGKVVRQRITILSPHALEELLMSMLSKEFRMVEYLGAALGFVIGLIQVALVMIEHVV